jgi:hypothetical protein
MVGDAAKEYLRNLWILPCETPHSETGVAASFADNAVDYQSISPHNIYQYEFPNATNR